ncbi:MAG: hypothetical protein ABI639_14985 [Thermoanaerobaculia bacterium]
MNRPIPLWVKIAYTVWMAVWVPLYWWQSGPANFLWICDFANGVVFVGIWLESPLLLSSQLAGVFIIQLIWAVDFLGALFFGVHAIGGTEYMFDPAKPIWLRGLSLFHLWTIPLLVALVRRIGYDRRGWRLETAIAAALFPLGVLFGTPEQNLNWMIAPFGRPQTWVPPLLLCLIALPIVTLLLFLPGDWLARLCLARRRPAPEGAERTAR